MMPFFPLFMIFSLIVLIFSLFYLDYSFVYLSSIIMVLLGIYSMVNGILDLNNWFTRSLSAVFIGIGLYVMIVVSLNSIEDIWKEVKWLKNT